MRGPDADEAIVNGLDALATAVEESLDAHAKRPDRKVRTFQNAHSVSSISFKPCDVIWIECDMVRCDDNKWIEYGMAGSMGEYTPTHRMRATIAFRDGHSIKFTGGYDVYDIARRAGLNDAAGFYAKALLTTHGPRTTRSVEEWFEVGKHGFKGPLKVNEIKSPHTSDGPDPANYDDAFSKLGRKGPKRSLPPDIDDDESSSEEIQHQAPKRPRKD